MSREPLDPEVVADLQLRAYSEHDRSRSRGDGVYDWKPPAVVTQWKCRTPPCKVFVDVNTETVERWEIFNKRLRAAGEKPIGSHEVMICESCQAEHAKIQPLRLRKRVERMADVIRQLKAGDKVIRYKTNEGDVATNEADAFKQLRVWGHPDVDGLIAAIGDKRNAAPAKRERRGGL